MPKFTEFHVPCCTLHLGTFMTRFVIVLSHSNFFCLSLVHFACYVVMPNHSAV